MIYFWYYPRPVDLDENKFHKTKSSPESTSPQKLPQTTEELKDFNAHRN